MPLQHFTHNAARDYDETMTVSEIRQLIREMRLKDFAIESSINAVAFSDLEGIVTYVNAACLRMWGCEDRSEMIGKRADFFARSSQEALEIMQEVLEKGSWEGESEGVRKDQSPIFVHLSAFLVTDSRGVAQCMMCSTIDITERKKIEEEMRLKDFAIESAINAIVLGDLEGTITYVNEAFVRLWGGSREEIIGESVFKFVHSKAEIEQIIESVLAGGSWFGESIGRNKQGELVHVELSANLVTNRDGEPVCLYTSFVDISDRKKAEAALNKAKQELEVKVEERTRSLLQANEQLKMEIEERRQAEEQLRLKEQELHLKARHLEEMNTALKVLLKQRENDRGEVEDKIVSNVKDLIMPYIHELANTTLNTRQRAYLDVIGANLESIVSPFAKKLSGKTLSLTPTQLKVAELIKSGKTTKEIADMMNISDRAVEFHRNNIRDKLGLKHKKVNLQSYLLSLA